MSKRPEAHSQSRYRNKSKFDNPPHAFAMANRAYQAMMHEKKNQRFVVTGESGAGKTVACNAVLKMLVYLGRVPFRNVEDKILQINPILEALGNCPTALNDNSSRFAKTVELVFSKVGNVNGARIAVFLLEHSRVVRQGDREQFHVFRYVSAGLCAEGSLVDFFPEDFPYQQYMPQVPTGKKDVDKFEELKMSFKMLGFRPAELNMIYQVILGIQLCRHLHFRSKQDETAEIQDRSVLLALAHLLGVSSADLAASLTTSHLAMHGEVISKSNTVSESESARDALAKGLYTRLFDYVVQVVNKLLSYSLQVYGESTSVGILDLFGFEDLKDNSLEQLCINTASEQINYYFHQYIFCWEREEYLSEEIPVHFQSAETGGGGLSLHHPHPSSKSVLDLVLGRPIGLLSLLDEESKFPSSSDRTLSAKLHANLAAAGSQVYESPRSSDLNQFKIRHYAYDVNYNTDGFVEKNRNFLPPEAIFVLRGSNHEVIRYIFSAPFAKTGRLTDKGMTNNKEDLSTASDHSQTRSQQTLATYFRYSLMDLLKITLNGSPHFIRCFKPNRGMGSTFDDGYMLQQLRYTGVLQIVDARREGYSHQMTFSEFLRRYCFLGFSFDERVLATRENCQLLLLRLRMDGYALGKTKVFLKHYHVEYLSKQYEYQIRKIVRVQAVVRRWLAALRCQREKWAVARRVFLMRIFATRWKIKSGVAAKVVTKTRANGRNNRRTSINVEALPPSSSSSHLQVPPTPDSPHPKTGSRSRSRSRAAVEIQRHIRGYFARKKIGQLLAKKVEDAVLQDDKVKLKRVSQDLQEEGLTPDEAARLIQSVYRRLKAQRSLSSEGREPEDVGDDGEDGDDAATRPLDENDEEGCLMEKVSVEEDEECKRVLGEIQQSSHVNNVEVHKQLKKNKCPVDLADVKKVSDVGMASKIRMLQQSGEPVKGSGRRRSSGCGGGFGGRSPGRHQLPTAETSGDKRRRLSLSCFYSDGGPAENWDGPLVKQQSLQRSRAAKAGGGGGGRGRPVSLAMTPGQSLMAASVSHANFMMNSEDRLAAVAQSAVQHQAAIAPPSPFSSALSAPVTPMSAAQPFRRSYAVAAGGRPQVPQGQANFVDHLKSLGKKDGGDGDGNFDFRSLLRKTDFAPTASLRRRKQGGGGTGKEEEEGGRFEITSPVAVLIKQPPQQQQPPAVIDEGPVIDL